MHIYTVDLWFSTLTSRTDYYYPTVLGIVQKALLLVVCILTRPAGSSKYSTTRENIRRCFTAKHLIRYMYYILRYYVMR